MVSLLRYFRPRSLAFAYFIAIVLGVLSGASQIEPLQALGVAVSDVFIKLFKCLSLPLIGLSIIGTIANYRPKDNMKGLWQKTLLYTFSTTVAAATVTFILYRLFPPLIQKIDRAESALPVVKNSSYLSSFIRVIPSNIFEPFLEHQVAGVLLVALSVGCAIRGISDENAKQTLSSFFKGLHEMFLVMTRWVVKCIPLALYGFITQTVLQLKAGMELSGIADYLGIIVVSNLIQGFIVLPFWLKSHQISPVHTFKAMMPALSLAFFSKSSAGTLPVTLDSAEKRMGIQPEISRFVLPLCTSINMNGCATFIFATVVFLMQSEGVQVSALTMVFWIFIATLAAIGNAGIPMGCFFLSASLLSSMGVPITLLGIILPFYGLIDMIETSLNVWSDACVATVIDKTLREEGVPFGAVNAT